MKTPKQFVSFTLSVVGFGLLCISSSLDASEQVEKNKATVQRYLEALGTDGFAAIASELEARDHQLLRHEFENLKYNADDPKLSVAMDPELAAITGRVNSIDRLIGEGDVVAAKLQVTGTHSGNLYGIPATGKSFDIASTAVFTVEDGKIVESWFMAEEARLLRQLGVRLPEREDGKINLPPTYDDTRLFDEALAELMENPTEMPEYRRKWLMLAYKAKNKPEGYNFTGRAYEVWLRSGIANIVERGAELGVEGSHGASNSNRVDRIGVIAVEGDLGMMTFRLTADNTGPLYGIPPSGAKLNFWEIAFATFDGNRWVDAWWMADELGFLLTIGNQEALDFLVAN